MSFGWFRNVYQKATSGGVFHAKVAKKNIRKRLCGLCVLILNKFLCGLCVQKCLRV